MILALMLSLSLFFVYCHHVCEPPGLHSPHTNKYVTEKHDIENDLKNRKEEEEKLECHSCACFCFLRIFFLLLLRCHSCFFFCFYLCERAQRALVRNRETRVVREKNRSSGHVLHKAVAPLTCLRENEKERKRQTGKEKKREGEQVRR